MGKSIRKDKIGSMKNKRASKFREKLDMYDMILASAFDKDSIVIPEETLDSRSLAVGYSCMASLNYVSKYYVVTALPDFVETQLYSKIRNACRNKGVVIDFFTYEEPHKIDWESPEMVSKLRIWKDYYEREEEGGVWEYRDKKQTIDNKKRIIMSTSYLNKAELNNRRTLTKVYFVIRITARRDRESILNMADSISMLRSIMQDQMQIKIRELRVNMMDWMRLLNPFSLTKGKVYNKIPKMVMTDDIEANFSSMRQGKVGITGLPLGMDIISGQVVLYVFKEDPEEAENILIAGETGSGKSYLLKPLIPYAIASGMVAVVMDYEGDEYTNLGNYIAASNPDDVCIINIGRNSEYYFDPCPIPAPTGERDIDEAAKQMAMGYIKLIYQKMICNDDDGTLTNSQTKIISLAIQRMYDSVGVTEDSSTWHSRSKSLRLKNVYTEILEMIESKEFYDPDGNNALHEAAISIIEATSVFFEDGEIYAGTFGKPLSLDKIYKAKLVIFSFGVKGQAASVTDKKILALKQISVAYVNTLISNHCKYVKKCFNMKIWEEGQRWLHVAGSSDIIINEITGGRKRGEINIIVTNNISELLTEADRLGEALTLNIQSYFIGKINKKKVRDKFCDEFQLQHISHELEQIAKAGSRDKNGRQKNRNSSISNRGLQKYNHAFVLIMKDGSTPVVRQELPRAITESKIYRNQRKENKA